MSSYLKFLFDRIVKSLIIVSEALQVAVGVIYQFVSCNEVPEPSIIIFFKYLRQSSQRINVMTGDKNLRVISLRSCKQSLPQQRHCCIMKAIVNLVNHQNTILATIDR